MVNLKRIIFALLIIGLIAAAGTYFWLEKQSISTKDIGLDSVWINDKNSVVFFNNIELDLSLKYHPKVFENLKDFQKGHLVIAAKIVDEDWRMRSSPNSFLLYSNNVSANELTGLKLKFPNYLTIGIGPKQSLSIFATLCPNTSDCSFASEGNIVARGIYSKIRVGRNSILLYFDTMLSAKANKAQGFFLQAKAKIPVKEMAKTAKNWLIMVTPAQTHAIFGLKQAMMLAQKSGFLMPREIIAYAGPIQLNSESIQLNFPSNSVLFPNFFDPILVKLVPCDRDDGDYYECMYQSIRISREKVKSFRLADVNNAKAIMPYSNKIYELEAVDW